MKFIYNLRAQLLHYDARFPGFTSKKRLRTSFLNQGSTPALSSSRYVSTKARSITRPSQIQLLNVARSFRQRTTPRSRHQTRQFHQTTRGPLCKDEILLPKSTRQRGKLFRPVLLHITRNKLKSSYIEDLLQGVRQSELNEVIAVERANIANFERYEYVLYFVRRTVHYGRKISQGLLGLAFVGVFVMVIMLQRREEKQILRDGKERSRGRFWSQWKPSKDIGQHVHGGEQTESSVEQAAGEQRTDSRHQLPQGDIKVQSSVGSLGGDEANDSKEEDSVSKMSGAEAGSAANADGLTKKLETWWDRLNNR